ncbi:MAG: TonB-dependent receptor, partial [Alistipes sp.]|nr:TonB-dependent receptor [Alistipes sp.]
RLDQDFTPRSMFTMVQAQQEHTLSQEVTLHRADPSRRWQWLSGVALFYKHTNMGAPVHFKQDGIEDLILSNINKGIHTVFPDADILFREQEFDILSDFRMPVFGAALYHQSQYRVGRFTFTAGLRLDYERASLHYDSRSGLGYRFTLTMKEFRDFTSELTGVEHRNFFEPLPKLALQYDLPRNGNLYLAITKGYKSGGYNTQIFSDILQNKMQVDMMKDLGITFEDGGLASYRVGEVITYDPEYSWNFEVGAHLDFWESRLRVDADLFLIECRDQQLTVFPSGKSTGRMMTNAGRTRSYGAEVALDAALTPALHLYGSYGYTHATFTQYHDGRTDYAGRWVPYVPRHTVGLGADYTLAIRSKALDQIILRLNYSGLGPIFWNEANTLQESFYSLLGGSLSFVRRGVRLDIWSRNLTNTAYNTFYFMSIGNSFLSQGKPRQYGVTLNWVF